MIWAIVGGALFTLVYWHRLLVFSQLPFDGNMLRLFFPSWVIGKTMLADGFSLLWDPYRNLGQPFLADPQNQALYPVRFLSLIAEYLTYQRLFVVFHTLLAAAPAALLAKRLAKDHEDLTVPFFAALAAGFNGLLLARVTLPSHYAAMAWVPCALYFLTTARPTLLALALAAQWMAGFPPFFILTLVILLGSALISNDRKASLLCLGKGAALGLGLSAVQWVPFLELMQESARGVFLPAGQATEFSLHPLELLRQAALPAFLHDRFPTVTSSDIAITGFYLGPVALGLAAWAAIKGGRTGRWLAGAALAAFVLALGEHIKIYNHIPFITIFRFPANWLLPATTALAAAAVLGLSLVPNKNLRWALFALAALDLLSFSLPMRTPWGQPSFFNETPLRAHGLETAVRGTRIFHTASIVDNAHTWKLDSGEAWLAMKGALVPSIGTAYGIEEAASYSVLVSARHLAFLRRLNQGPETSALFDMAGINKIISASAKAGQSPALADFTVRENAGALPRQFFLNDGTAVASWAYFPGWRATVDGQKRLVTPYENEFPSVVAGPGKHDVRFTYTPNSFRIGLALSLLTSMIAVALFVRYRA